MNVLVTYRTSPAAAERTVAELKALGVEASAFGVDLADAAAVARLADAVLAQAGASLAVVVNSASVDPRTRLGDISAETWDSILAANRSRSSWRPRYRSIASARVRCCCPRITMPRPRRRSGAPHRSRGGRGIFVSCELVHTCERASAGSGWL